MRCVNICAIVCFELVTSSSEYGHECTFFSGHKGASFCFLLATECTSVLVDLKIYVLTNRITFVYTHTNIPHTTLQVADLADLMGKLKEKGFV